jgi:hypothetical protein
MQMGENNLFWKGYLNECNWFVKAETQACLLPAVETAARVTNPASAGFLRHTGGLYDPCSGFIHQALNTKVENDH